MKGATSIHIEPCKIGSSEAHNLRQKELPYVNSELSSLNKSYIAPGGADLAKHMEDIRATYEHVIGQRMQKKASPIREGVIVMGADTTMGDLQEFAKQIELQYGIRTMQIHIHEDEGHYDEFGEWQTNRHAHIVFNYFDNLTAKTKKLTPQDLAQMQTTLAECLHMQRGDSSDIKHLNSIQFKNQEQTKQLIHQAEIIMQAEQYIKELKEQQETFKRRVTALCKTESDFNEIKGICAKNGLKIDFKKETPSATKQTEIKNKI